MKIRMYARVSTYGQDSTKAQVDELLKVYNERKSKGENIELIGEPVEEKRTASDRPDIFSPDEYLKYLPELQAIYLSAKVEPFDELWVWKIDRFTRSDIPLVRYFESTVGVKIWCLNSSNDPMSREILSVVARNESRMVKERMHMRYKNKFDNGKPLWTYMPRIGYTYDKKKEMINWDVNRGSVELVFQRVALGTIVPEVARTVPFVRNYKTRYHDVRGSTSHKYFLPKKTVYSMIRNPFYCGELHYKGEMKVHDKPIVTKELWEKANARLKK